MKEFFTRAAATSSGAVFVLLVRFAVGVTIGVFAHYLFYRVSLPVEPFIYVAF